MPIQYRPIEYWDTDNILGSVTNSWEYATLRNFKKNIPQTYWVNCEDSSFYLGQYYTAIRLLQKNGVNLNHLDFVTIEDQEAIMSKLYWGFGFYRRNPNKASWGSEWCRFSRDQQKPVISAESFNPKSWKRVLPFMLNHFVLRLGLFDAKFKENGSSQWKIPTFTGPTIWSSYIRYLISQCSLFYVLYPLLLILDIEILVNTFVKQGAEKHDNDVNNHICYSIWFHEIAPTPWTYWNLKKLNELNFKERLMKYYDNGERFYFIGQLWCVLLDMYQK